MNKLQASSSVLNNGDIAVEMIYNNKSHAKKLIIFFMVAIVMAAIAFSACFFALEISRTNAYNNRLNNSIVQPEPETPPEIINPTTPENNSTTDNNESGGSASDESETGANYQSPTGYRLTIQTVWGLSASTANINSTGSYTLEQGVSYGRLNANNFYIGITDGGRTESNFVRVWRGASYNSTSPTYTHSTSPEVTDSIVWGSPAGNHTVALGTNKDGDEPFGNNDWKVCLYAKNMENLTSNYVISLGYISGNAFQTIASKICTKGRNNSLTVENIDYYSGKNLFAVITKDVTITLKTNTATLTASSITSGSRPYNSGAAYVTNVYYNRTVKSLKMLNCVGTAKNYFPQMITNNGTFIFDHLSGAIIHYYVEGGNYLNAVNTPEDECFQQIVWANEYIIYNDDVHRSVPFDDISPFQYFDYVDNNSFRIGLESDKVADVTASSKTITCYSQSHVQQVLNENIGASITIALYKSLDVIKIENSTRKGSLTIETSGCYIDSWSLKGLTRLNINGTGDAYKLTIENIGEITTGNGKYNKLTVKNSDNVILNCQSYRQDGMITISTCKSVSVNNVVYGLNITDSKVFTNNNVNNGGIIVKGKSPYLQIGGDTVSGDIDLYNRGGCLCVLDGVEITGNINRYENTFIDLNNETDVTINLENVEESTYIDERNITNSYPICVESATPGNITININKTLVGGEYKLLDMNGKYTVDGDGKIVYAGAGTNNGTETGQINLNSNIGSLACTYVNPYTKINLEITGSFIISSFVGKNADGTINADGINADGTYSIDWMLKQEVLLDTSLTGTYQLQNDITIPENAGFTGIGNNYPFAGVFDGAGHKITFESGNQGLFFQIQDATIKNLVLDGVIDMSYRCEVKEYGGFFYGLVYENVKYSKSHIANVFSNLNISNGFRNASAGLVYHNGEDSTINFVNCAVMQAPVDYSGVGPVGDRSAYLGRNTGKALFYNCVAKDTGYSFSTENSGLFVGNQIDVTKESLKLKYVSFENCHIIGTFNSDKNQYQYFNRSIGVSTGTNLQSIGFSSYTSWSMDVGALTYHIEYKADISDEPGRDCYNKIQDFQHSLNSYIDSYSTFATGNKGKIELYSWLNGYLLFFPNVATEERYKEIASTCSDLKFRAMTLGGSFTLTGSNYSFTTFAGVLEGNGNFITIHHSNADSLVNGGVCGVIRNIKIIGNGFFKYGYSFASSCHSSGVIENCSNSVSINNSGGNIGGIVGSNQGMLKNCNNFGDITVNNNSSTWKIGGIAGENSGTLNKCNNSGNIKLIFSGKNSYTQSIYLGGIAGKSDITIQNCQNNGSITISNTTSTDRNKTLYVGGIVGENNSQSLINCVNIGDIVNKVTNTGITVNIAGLVWQGNTQNSVFKGTIQSDGTVYLLTNNGNTTSCAFIGDVLDGAGNKRTIANGAISGIYITGNGTATRCFVQSDSTKILNSPTTKTGVTYTGCSTFKDVTTSLMYNGSRFGYLVDALSDPSNNVYWSLNEDGYPVIDKTKTCLTTTLTITELDNLNAINNMVVDNKVNYSFDGLEMFFVTLHLNTFAGLGDNFHSIKGGTWDGDNKTIYVYGNPLFNNVWDATIQNFQIEEGNDANKGYSLINVSYNCTIKNCINYANLTAVDGQLSYDPTEPDNTEKQVKAIGGIVAYSKGSKDCNIEDCLNFGKISSSIESVRAGGVVGYIAWGSLVNVKNCINRGSISTSSGTVGGVIGRAANALITSCVNFGSINGETPIGGIVGQLLGSTVDKCENYGSIIGTTRVGGIAADVYNDCTITNCFVESCITGDWYVGGVVGYASSGGETTIQNCITEGVFKTTKPSGGRYCAGIAVSSNNYTINCTNCVSFAVLEAPMVAGLVVCLTVASKVDEPVANTSVANINNGYFFGDIISNNYKVIAKRIVGDSDDTVNINIKNCGYNTNNEEIADTDKNNGAGFIYVKTNPVWSSTAYIKMLFKTETEKILDDDPESNKKLELSWADTDAATVGTQTGFDAGFWNGVFTK